MSYLWECGNGHKYKPEDSLEDHPKCPVCGSHIQNARTELDDKLRFYYNAAKQEADCEKWVDGLMQALDDEGYYQLTRTNLATGKTEGIPKLMTGQDWYDRFEQELAKEKNSFLLASQTGQASLALESSVAAAKRAAELDK